MSVPGKIDNGQAAVHQADRLLWRPQYAFIIRPAVAQGGAHTLQHRLDFFRRALRSARKTR